MAYTPNYYGYNPYMNGAMPDMLNQYKGQYHPQIPMQQPAPMQNTTNDMLWVLGEVEAQSYPVAPNNTVTLWDKNQPTIYIKSANAQGVPSIRILDFTERTVTQSKTAENHVCKCGDNFVTKEQFKDLEGKFDDLTAKFETLSTKATVKTSKLTKGDVE